jgi:hypothetical protein
MSSEFSLRLNSILPTWLGGKADQTSIDLGGGRLLPAEDVLESHFRRMSERTSALQSGTQDVTIEIAPNLNAAIRVVAPKLAPLTEIAEELSHKIGTVTPDTQFRTELHRALEEAHRQLAAQRAAQPQTRWFTSTLLWVAIAGISVALFALSAAALFLRKRTPTA